MASIYEQYVDAYPDLKAAWLQINKDKLGVDPNNSTALKHRMQ